MNQANQLYRISQLLSRCKEQVKILNANGEFSINIHAENILLKVLNEVYNCNLENVNYTEGKTYPAIDLRDKEKKIAFQITATATQDKINNTLEKFISKSMHKAYDKLYVFIITDKHAKYNQRRINEIVKDEFSFTTRDIIDCRDVYTALCAQNDKQKIDSVAALLEKQFADKATLDKWDLYTKGMECYDQYIKLLYSFLDIKGFSPKINNALVKISLESIYVPLQLVEEKEDNTAEKEDYSIEKALRDFNKLVILGDPGSGKSTILKHLAYKICSDRGASNLVPVFIKGSEYAKYQATESKGLAEFIIDQLNKKYAYLFTEKLERDQLLVLVDGIDEINKIKLRHDVVDRINDFIAQYPATKIIVSSRIVGYKEARLNGQFNHLEVGKFKWEQIEQFTRNWYTAIALKSDNDALAAARKAKELFHDIRKNESVFRMAGTPLLMTIIALIHYQGNALPEKRASLYDISISTFLENWVRQREMNKRSNFDKETLIEMLSPVSFHMHLHYNTGLIAESELKALLYQEYRKIYPCLTQKDAKSDIKDIIEFLREDAGFLFEKGTNEQGESMFGFVHQTFQEYFAAIEFVTRWKEGAFQDILGIFVFDANWREVIRLAASIFRLTDSTRIGRQNASKFVLDILGADDVFSKKDKPLEVVLDILKDNTEVDFEVFKVITDKVFAQALEENARLPQAKIYSNELHYFSGLKVRILFGVMAYRSYLLERYIAEIGKKENPTGLIGVVTRTLILQSEDLSVEQALISLIRTGSVAIKWQIFNHSISSSSAGIFNNSVFGEELFKYVNSDGFAKVYKGFLPRQLFLMHNLKNWEPIKTEEEEWEEKFMEQFLEEHILSLNLIKNDKMRMNFVETYFSEMIRIIDAGRYLDLIEKGVKGMDIAAMERMKILSSVR